jgi:anaerobic dimethyl sulfoxide reductase subunit A
MSDSMGKGWVSRRSFLKSAAATGIAAAMAEQLGGESMSKISGEPGVVQAAEGARVFDACCPSLGLCTATCPLKVTVEAGRITHITNHPDYLCCTKGHALRSTVYDPTRLRYPMKRAGERGEGQFSRISWDEALYIYAGKIRQTSGHYGSDAILFYPARGTMGLARLAPKVRFANLLGMVTVWGSLCIANKTSVAPMMYGTMNTESDLQTIKDSKLAIIWGYGFADSNRRVDFAGEGMRTMMDAREKGTRIVVIDPFCSQTAGKADQWIPIMPGTDGAMALAMANVIINRGLYDKDFVARHVSGFEEFQQHVQKYTPAWAAKITGVPAKVITELAVEYATQQPAALFPGDGPSRVGRDPSQWVLACGALAAITGSLGRPGTNATAGFGFNKGFKLGNLAAAEKNKVTVQVNECQIADAILTGKAIQPDYKVAPVSIRMLICHGSSVINQTGDSNKIAKSLKKLDYIICADHFMTPFARYADLLLPATTTFEGNDAGFYAQAGHAVVYGEKCIEPMYECRSDLEMWAAVAERLGIGAEYHSDWKDVDWMRETLKVSVPGPLAGITLERLQKEKVVLVGPRPFIPFQEQVKEGKPFPTKSGKIELYSKTMEARGLPPLPTYLDEFENPRHPLAKKYPLAICTPHSVAWLHSRSNNRWVNDLFPVDVFINPADAARRKIKSGDMVRIFNDRGATERRAKLSERVPAGVIAMHQGPWYKPAADSTPANATAALAGDPGGVDRGGGVNTVTSDSIDRVGGAATYNSTLVEVKRI